LERVLRDPSLGDSWNTRRIEYDYPGVIEALEKVQAPLAYSWGVVGHLMGVKNSDDLRAAHDKIQPSVIEVYQKIGQSKSLYKALTALKKRHFIWSRLEEAQQRVVDSALRQMENAGVGLQSPEREAFNALQLEQAELSTKFSNNILDSTKLFKLRLIDSDDVMGLPESAKALAAQNAAAAGDEGATADAGPWLITLDMPSYLPAMQHLKSRAIRETLYRAYVTRASSGDHDNAPLVARMLQIKQSIAQMLGYTCFAEKSLAGKMADSVEQVGELTEMLREKAMPAAVRELAELKEFAAEMGFTSDMALWDVPFWSERLREKSYQFQEEELRAYFPLPAVLDGLFALANRLFGVTIKAADGEADVWHEQVGFFKITDDATGQHIASFFLDPYSRPAEKRGGAWMDVCLGKSKVLQQIPVAYLTCNGSPPVGKKPSLMTFREVETLFHEFGHGLQHMLTTVQHGDAAGINNVEWDAVELPSQFMENWCYDRPTLYGFAKHYETGVPLPEELFNKIKAAKNFQAGMGMLRQLYFGTMDLHLHSAKHDAFAPSASVFEVQHALAPKYTVIPPLKDDRFLCSFGHIFAGGYSAGYYSYKWAEVMSADAFAAFEEAGLDDEAAVKETGRRFRDTVLSMGGGKHPSAVYRDFRGRDPSPEALLRHSGLTK
ncbi:peptidase M3A and M3B, thimet/oligopeptidase F, partial [Ochromonadaceae sp. CCMP2298]